MPNVALRAYLDDLAHLIDQEALEEVIGHCKYILTKFPKNVAVYRLYGSALAGKSRFDEARDIFERVLSASPNDFGAHVSMSEIFQEQGQEGMARAIWHLERAYEQDPNNAALQDELKRLYDRRDGAPPETINLTRGALARLYYKSQLYDQAAAELNVALREAPDRPDLLILLAESQWENHRPVEAGETALRILNNFPYSSDANRLMAKLWLENNRPSDAQEFIERLAELDPFEALDLVKPGDEDAKTAITIQRLDWNARSSATMLANAPDWVQGMGDFFDAPAGGSSTDDPFNLSGGRAGDWKSNFTAPTDVPVPKTDWFSTGSAFSQAAQSKTSEDLPDWFADAQMNPPAQPAQPAIPSWLSDVETDPTPSNTPRQSTGFTDLLNEFGAPAQPPAAKEQHTGFTDLLNEFGGSAPASTDPTGAGFDDLLNEFGGTPSIESAPADIPSWLQESEPESSSTGDAPIPDWMNDAPTDFPDFSTDFPSDLPATSMTDDWMTAPQEAAPADSSWTPEETTANAAGNVPDWLNDAPSFDESGTLPSDLIAAEPPAQPAEHIPDWLHDIPKVDMPTTGTLSQLGTGELVGAEFGDLVAGHEQPPSEDWLKPLAPKIDAAPSELPAADDWLSELRDTPASTSEPAAATENADWLSAMPDLDMGEFRTPLENTPIEALPSFPEMHPIDDAPAQPAEHWLNELQDAPASEPAAATENADWLSAMPDLDMSEFRTPLENTPIEALPSFPEMHPIDDAPAQPAEHWLNELQDTPASEPAAATENADWLSAMPDLDMREFRTQLEDAAPSASPIEALPSFPEMHPVDEAPADDWLSNLRDTPVEPVVETGTPEAEENADWLSAMPDLDMSEFRTPLEDSATAAEVPANDDWLNTLASTESTPEAAEPLLTAADMPAWIDDNAPVAAETLSDPLDWMSEPLSTDTVPDEKDAEAPSSQPISELFGDDSDWLKSLNTAQPEQPEKSLSTDELLDWMSEEGAKPAAQIQSPVPTAPPQAETDLDTLNLDDWMNDLAAEPTDMEASPAQPEVLPEITNSSEADVLDDDWLRNFEIEDENPQSGLDLGNLMQEATITPPEAAPMSELPIEEDWLTSFEPESSLPAEVPAQPTGDNWLDQLAANAPPPREPLTLQEAIIEHPVDDSQSKIDWGTTSAKETPATVSTDDWLSSLGASISPAEQQPEAEVQDTTPDWMRDMPAIESDAPSVPEKKTGMTDMLGRIKRGETAPPPNRETGVLDPNRLPDWMGALGGEPLPEYPPEPAIPDAAPMSLDSIPDDLAVSGTADLDPDWLQSMASGTTEDEPQADLFAELPAEPQADAGSLDWLQGIGNTPIAETQAESTATGGNLDWLNGEPEAESAGDVPSWLQGIAPVEGSTAMIDDVNPEFEVQAEPRFDFGTGEAVTPEEQQADEIDINALLRELNSGGLAKENELVDNTSSSRFKFDRVPAWLRKRNN